MNRQTIEACCALVGSPCDVNIADMPVDYVNVLRLCDGFVTRSQAFRLFPYARALGNLPTVRDWSAQDFWKNLLLFDDFIVIGEDIFGDQYGFRSDGVSRILCRVRCEGGECDDIPFDTATFLSNALESGFPWGFDEELFQAASEAGIVAQCNDASHLSFSLPLICGGEYDLSNLGVESRVLHLGILSQMTQSNRTLPDGTPISGFSDS